MSQREVLVVDDSPSARFAMRKHLERYRCAVTTAENGTEALDYLRSNRPLAVFLDQLMPGPSGLEVLRALKSDPSTVMIPVVICTSIEEIAFHQEARSSGAVDVLQKPPSLERLQRLLLELARPVAEVAVVPAPAPASPPAAAGLILTPAESVDRYGVLRGEINTHLTRLTEEIFVQMAELKTQLARVDSDGLSGEERDTLREIAREEADTLHQAVRQEINAIRHRLDTLDFLQRKDREDLLRAVRATAAAEALTVAENTVNDVVTKLSHRISETLLKALGRQP